MKTEQRKKEDRELLKDYVKYYKTTVYSLDDTLADFIKENDLEETKPFTIKQVAKGLEDLQKEIELLKSKIN